MEHIVDSARAENSGLNQYCAVVLHLQDDLEWIAVNVASHICEILCYLVREGAAHDERGVSHSTAKVDEAARGQEDDVPAVWELVAVNLRLDVGLVNAVVIQPLKWTKNKIQWSVCFAYLYM